MQSGPHASEPREASNAHSSHPSDDLPRDAEEEEEAEAAERHRDLAIARFATHTSPDRDAEKAAPGPGGGGDLELTRTVSTRLSRVASRITTRDLRDPGPPPDGGVKAWTQVAMAFALTSSTWGYVNSFGESARGGKARRYGDCGLVRDGGSGMAG